MKRETIFLAALIHDIGKFWQRADTHGTTKSEILSTDTKNNVGLYCPQYDGHYSHKHVLWTAQFLDQNKSFFQTILADDSFESLFKATVKHHTPDQDDVYQKIVQKADHYASGVDRTKEAGQKDAKAENNWNAFKNVAMVSIFEGLSREIEDYSYHVPIKSLGLNEELFPVPGKASEKGQKQYALLWEGFESGFNKLKQAKGNAWALGDNLSSLLYRYASAVPSSTIHLPDVSLYDHLKSTAIFALCLHDYLKSKERLTPNFEIHADESPILLVGGDLSGIQKYIYDIVSTDAARNLKGRSFYLQILVDNVVDLILHTLGLPRAAVLYSSGGGFYLLVPNTSEVVNKLSGIRKELTTQIFQLHQTNLSLLIDWQAITQHAIFNQDINKYWEKLAQKIAKLKTQKFKEVIQSEYAYFFEPGEIGGKQVRDYITGEEFSEEENACILSGKPHYGFNFLDGDEMRPIKKMTAEQIDLGKKLRKTDYWVSSLSPIPKWREYEFRIGALEIYNYLLSERDLLTESNQNPDNARIRSFNIDNSNFDEKKGFFKGHNCVYEFTFYGGNDYPGKPDGSRVTFDEMARMGKGAQKLGVLRMDVDNLGLIFSSGLDNRRRTFSRYSTLSRQLDFFFKGYINKIWRDHFRENCSIIYSGGDDLFLVGQWDAVIEFAQQIQENFSKWVCHNPKLTISGGIELTGGKFPISKGAKFSEQAESKAKEHTANGICKSTLTIFGVPLNWDLELPIVMPIKQEMVELIQKGKLPRGVLQKLLNYAKKAKYQQEQGKSHTWRWQMAYDFSRAAKRHDEILESFYGRLRNASFEDKWNEQKIPHIGIEEVSKRSFLDLLEVAAKWAEMETKE